MKLKGFKMKNILFIVVLLMSCTEIVYNREDSVDFERYQNVYITIYSQTSTYRLGLDTYEEQLYSNTVEEFKKTTNFSNFYTEISDSGKMYELANPKLDLDSLKLIAYRDSVFDNYLFVEITIVYEDGSISKDCDSYGGTYECRYTYESEVELACVAKDYYGSKIKSFHVEGTSSGENSTNNYSIKRNAVVDGIEKIAFKMSKGFKI